MPSEPCSSNATRRDWRRSLDLRLLCRDQHLTEELHALHEGLWSACHAHVERLGHELARRRLEARRAARRVEEVDAIEIILVQAAPLHAGDRADEAL